jgi:hypothetical protein
MKPFVLAAFLLASLMPAAQPQRAKVTRAALAPLESSFDARIGAPGQPDPFDLLGNTRGVYLEGYGAVFSAEANLIVLPLSPFRPALTKDEIANIHRRKLAKLDVLKKTMKDLLVSSAAALGGVPPEERVVVAVTLFYYSWEQRAGLPAQVVMQAPRSALVKGAGPALDAVLKVEEF